MNTNDRIGAYEAAVREIRNKDKREGLRYWKNLLDGFSTRTEIPSFGEVPEAERCAVSELGIEIDADVTCRFADLCRSEETTVNVGVQLAWGMVLHTYSRSEDVVFAKVVSGRDNTTEDVSRTIGLFINTVPVRMTITKESTAREMLRALQDQSAKSSEYDYCSLAEIQAQSELGSLLFQTVLSFQNYGSGRPEADAAPKKRSFRVKSAVMKEETFDDLTPVAFLNGDRLRLNLRFDRKKYRESEIRCILNLFETFVRGIGAQPDKALVTLDRLSEGQRGDVLRMCTGPELVYDTAKTWIDMFLSRVREQPEHVAVTDGDGAWTYRELDRLSDSVAQYLLEKGIGPNAFVVVKMHRYKEFAAAVIGVHKVGACYVPIDPDYPEDRIAFMESDCEARLVLSRELVAECARRFPDPAPVRLTRPDHLAYMIYTSGSTGRPKGAMIPQSALMNYTQIYIRRFGVTSKDRISHHITFSFDSHIRDFYPALAAGASLHFMPDGIVKDPALICEFLKNNRITGAAFATTMGQLLLTEFDLDLRFVSVGGEALRGVTGSDIHVFNVCGATEVTDVVLDYELEKGRYYESVPIGKPLENCCAFILDPYGNLLPKGIPGEICYVGRNVGCGYWNREELTRAAFTDCPILPGQTMYHTRDLGRYNQDGDVEYMGRLDFQVKLRGYRIELGEVESVAIKYPGVRQVVAAVSDDRLCLYYTAEEPLSQDKLNDYLATSLAEYMVPDAYMQLDAMPLTPSGKIDKKNLPKIETAAVEIVSPANELEQKLFDLIRNQLHYDGFGVTSNLISQGMTSLGIMRLSGTIQTQFHVSVGVSELMKEPFIRNIARKIEEKLKAADAPEQRIHAYAEQEVYPASENQIGVYLDWEMNRDTTQYNIPVAFSLADADAERFGEAIRKALSAHPYMYSRFEIRNGQVVQIPRTVDEPQVPVTELTEEPDTDFFQSLVRPFDLNRDILYRFELYTWQDRTWLFMDVHHILFDGLSESVFMRDVLEAYAGRSVHPEKVTAYDYALFEQEQQRGGAFEEAKKYFAALLADAHVMSYPHSAVPDGTKQGEVVVRIDAAVVDRAGQSYEVTAGSFLHAAFGETMRRLLWESDPMYLTISNGRTGMPELDRSVGMFVKTVPVVCRAQKRGAGSDSVRAYVRSVSEQLRDTYQRELYPYTKLVEETGLHGEILFVYQGGMYEGGEVEGADAIELKLDTLKFPLTVTAYPIDGYFQLRFEYDGERYAAKDIQILAHAMQQVVRDMAYEETFANVHLNDREGEREIVTRSMGSELPYDSTCTWLDHFEETVRTYPDNTSLADERRTLSYTQLDRESDAVAAWLIDQGVQENQFVALCMDRCAEFVVAVAGIHKAGAAYLPVDMNYPEARRQYMLTDSETKVVLTQEAVEAAVRTYANASPVRRAKPDGYAYMIYTSGSTGKPKGTILHHRGLLNFTLATMAENELTSADRIGHHFSFSFDSHIEDLYPPLLAGASIHLMPESIRRDPDLIYRFLTAHRITGGGFTTSVGRLMAANYPLPQRYVAIMGEALTEITPGETTVINKYGPTECTNIVATYILEPGRNYKEVPIGRPMPGGAVFLLDTRGDLVPYGCIGELCYAGPQVGYGYWKMPERTAEVFTECPWMPGMKLYHTGDLARYGADGQLAYLGRIDNQVKVNGFRVEFGEIESAALRYAGVNQAAAAVRQGRIVLYYTAKSKADRIDEEDLRAYMSRSLAEYMMPHGFVRLDAMPSTPSGKVDRRALPEPTFLRTVQYVAPVTETEKAVTKSLQKILGVPEAIGVHDNFFELGGDSIKAIRLVSLLRDEGITIGVADVMKGKTAARIAERAAAAERLPEISQAPIEGPVGTAPIMQYFLELQLPVPNHFNQSLCLACRKRPDLTLLQKSLDALTFQHDMLRAVLRDGKLVVRNAAETIPILTYECGSMEEMTAICGELQAGIRMDQALMSAALFRVEDSWYLVLIAHHLIIDAVSWRIILSDIEKAYARCLDGREPALSAKTNTYRDYVDAMQRFRDGYALSLEIPYWTSVQEKMLRYPVSVETDYSRTMGALGRRTDRERTARVLRAEYGKLGAEIDDALLTAVSRSYARIWQTDGVSFQFEGHGREDMGEPLSIDRTVGWFTSIYPMVVERLSGDLLDDFIRVKETRHRVPRKGIGYAALRYLKGDGAFTGVGNRCARIGFNYLGEIGEEQTQDSFFRLSGGTNCANPIAEANVFGPDLSLNAAVTDGCLSCGLTYNTAVCSEEKAAQFLDGVFIELDRICDLLAKTKDARRSASDLGETVWSMEEFEAVRHDFASRGQEIQRIYPLTPMQESMLLKHISDPESMAYRLGYVFEVNTLLTKEAAERAVSRLERKHEVLRTAFIYEGVSVPRQAIVTRSAQVEMRDISDRPEPEAAARELRLQLLGGVHDLQREPNFRVIVAKKDESSCYLFILVHHMLVDGWCNTLYMGDLYRFLLEEMGAQVSTEPEDEPLDGRYEQAVRDSLIRDRRGALRYWEELLKDYEGDAEIPSYGTVPAEDRCAEDTLSVAVDQAATKVILDLCRQQQATVSNAVELLWGLVLQTYTRSRDVVFAKVVSGRDHTEGADKVVGLFINSVPVRVQEGAETTAREMLSQLHEQATSSADWDFCPLVEIQNRVAAGRSLVQSVLAFENYTSGLAEIGVDQAPDRSALPFTMVPFVIKEEVFGRVDPLTYIDEDGRLTLKLAFDRSAYTEGQMRTVLNLFRTFAEGIAADPNRPLSALPRLTTADAAHVLQVSSGANLPLDGTRTWLDLFRDSVRAYGSSEAVVDVAGSISYKDLDLQSDAVAAFLLGQGVREGSFVAIRMRRVKEYVTAILGVHKAKAAFVPIDPDLPEDRIAFMLQDADCRLILDTDTVRRAVEQAEHPLALPDVEPADRAYMIYTSGSTGVPKGVVQSHRSLFAFASWRCRQLQVDHASRHGQYIGFSFDASLDDLICPLCAGGRVYILDQETRKDLDAMDRYVRDNRISAMALPAQIGMALINAHPDIPLTTLVMGGESLVPVRRTRVRLINEYGPTEFTVCSSYHEVDQEKDREIPIGRPVPGTGSLILDEAGNLLPLGVVGELCLTGPQIADGYWNRPDLTAEKFADLDICGASRRVYRTGDLARYDENGELVFHGRLDRQIKIRGFRIEPGEIESRAAQFPGVAAAAVDVRQDRIVLYYTSADGVDEAELKAFLADSLADYMVPAVYMRLLEMPLSANGKIEHRKLPDIPAESGKAYVAPEGAVETTIAEVIRGYLGLKDPVSAEDDFFALGGDSIKVIRILSALREAGIELKAADVMKAKTVRAMAALAGAAGDAGASAIDQGPYSGQVRNAAITRFFCSLHLPVPSHFNQTLLLKLRDKADAAALTAAWNALTEHHDMLRAIWTEEGLYVREATLRIPLEEYKTDADDFTAVCDAMQRGIRMDQALVRAALIHTEAEDLFFVAAHHLIVDSVSWSILGADLETAYGDAVRGREIRLPARTNTYRDYAEAQYAYRDSYALVREIPYWDQVEAKLVSACSERPGPNGRTFAYLGEALDEAETQAFLRSGFGEERVKIDEALLTAVSRSYSTVTGARDVSFQFEGHGRETPHMKLVTDRTVGWFTAAYPVVVEDAATDDLQHDLIQARETLRRVPNRGVGYMVLRYIPGRKKLAGTGELLPQIGFNYMGEMDTDRTSSGYFRAAAGLDTGRSMDERNGFGPDLSLNLMVTGRRLIVSAGYSVDRFTETQIREFLLHMRSELREIGRYIREEKAPFPALPSDFGETEWSLEEFKTVERAFASRNEHIRRIYPLLPLQQGMLLAHTQDPEAWGYRLVSMYELNRLPSKEQMLSVLEQLAERHEVLRTAIVYKNVSVPRQVVSDRRLGLIEMDLSDVSDKEAAIYKVREELLTHGFDLQDKPLFQVVVARISDSSCYLVTAVHHIIVDGWCIKDYMNDLFGLIAETITGRKLLAPSEDQPGSYEAAVREILDKDQEAALDYWNGLLSGYEARAEIPSYGRVPEAEQSDIDDIRISIDRDTTDALQALCRSEQATLSVAAEMIWGLVLQTYNHTRDVVFTKVVSGRDLRTCHAEHIVGMFINSIPIRVKTTADTTVRELLRALERQAADTASFDYCPLDAVQAQSELGANLYQSVFSFENFDSGLTAERVEDREAAAGGMSARELSSNEENYTDIHPYAFQNGRGELVYAISFDRSKYRKVEIQRILSLVRVLVSGMIEKPDLAVDKLPRLSAEDAAKMMALSRGRDLAYNTEETWMDRFLRLVETQPDHLAVTDDVSRITYRELNRQADAVAGRLLRMGIQPNDFVGIKLHRVKEFAVAVVGIHKAGACYVPIDPDYPKDRIEYMEKDCEARVVLTEETVKAWVREDPEPEPVHLTRPEQLAYMIYTSGSTGLPKGAMIPQSALMNYTEIYIRRFGITPEDRVSHHITFSFDSHIRDFYPALAGGASLHFMPDRICKDPEEIYDFLIRNRITVSAFATAMGRLLIHGYDLKQRVVSVGGEALHDVSGGDVRVINICGATEVTDIVLDYELEKGRYYESVPLGRPLENCYAFIMDEAGNLLPQGVPGEICYVGRNVGNGYWHKEELTRTVFTDCPVLPGQIMYHTRDLGRYNEEGDVEYMGRLDSQIKLRGYRIELGEIESNALRYEAVKQAAADVRDGQLVLYYVADRRIDPEALRAFLAQSLTDYMVPTAYRQLDAMPMTPSGKFDRKKLPAPGKAVDEIVAPADELEEQLRQIIRGMIHYDEFGVTNNLIALGLNSLGVMRLSGMIQARYQANVRVADMMKEPTIRSIADRIRKQRYVGADGKLRIHAYDRRSTYPVTENQRGVFLDWEMHPNTTQYNVPYAFGFRDVDAERMKAAIAAAVAAHPYLNVGFALRDGELLQVRRDELRAEIEVIALKEAPTSAFFQSLVRPFDLLQDVLYRFQLYTYAGVTWVFMDIHHIVYDGLSSAVLMGDIQKAYFGETIEPETVTAFDFALYEKELEGGEAYREAEKYFADLVEGANALSIPDSEEPDGSVYGKSELHIPAETVDGMTERCQVTSGSLLQAAFGETLMRLTREKNLLYLTISSGRSETSELEHTVGMFVKTLPVVRQERFDTDDSLTVHDYVQAVHRQLGESISREFYPYTRLVERYGVRGEILFIYQGSLFEGGEVKDSLTIPLQLNETKLPLYVTAYPAGGEYVVSIEYDGRKYSRRDMDRITHAMGNVLHSMANEVYLKDVSTLSEAERREIVAASAGEMLTVDDSKTWLDLFSERMPAYRERFAVADDGGSMTYGELDEASDAIAAYLREQGVSADDFVALKMDRVKEFVAAVLGIHKAGAAYVPIDPNYPAQRQAYMLANAGAKAELTEESARKIVREYRGQALPHSLAVPDGYAYMIYTSGSTGAPKGAVLHHRGLLNFTLASIGQNRLTEDDRIGLHFSFSFDSHIEDVFPVLLSGASIHVMPERIRRDPDQIVAFLREHRITGGGYTTSVARLLVQNYKLPQRYITAIGEALTEVTQPEGLQIINKYGPTECTNVVSLYYLEQGRTYAGVPIGRPMPNGYAFIVDPRGQLVPAGVAGELCYAGPQVGYGYWQQNERTEEAFGRCPFVDDTRMYRTGDLARYDQDGELEYLGRIDSQVKVNGYRIELGEIESRALKLPQIRQAAAVVRNGRIVLYYTLKEPISSDRIRDTLAQSLAQYMVPSAYMQLDALPQTPNGKIDRRNMPEPIGAPASFANVAPATPEEAAALAILKELIPGVTFGVTDDLFEVGINSLIAMKLVAQLTCRTHGTYKVGKLLSCRTVRSFLQEDAEICRYHRPYDPNKPVLVVPSGNTTLVGTEHLYRSWDDRFNVLVIEPLAVHYEKLLPGRSFDEVVEYYLELIEGHIPDGAVLFGFLGFSFGGEIAYHLACKWVQKRGGRPVVILGDTFLKRTIRQDQVEQLTRESFGTALERFMVSEGLSMDEILYMANLMRRLDATEKKVTHYDGPVVYLNARKGNSEETLREKLQVLREIEPEAEMLDLNDQDHGSIFMDPEMEATYRQIFARFGA